MCSSILYYFFYFSSLSLFADIQIVLQFDCTWPVDVSSRLVQGLYNTISYTAKGIRAAFHDHN